MATQDDHLKITCPCCQATIALDRETLNILYVTEHREKAGGASFEQLKEELEEKKKQMSSHFQQALNMSDPKQRRALLDKKFRELQKRAAENPDEERPLRPFDLE